MSWSGLNNFELQAVRKLLMLEVSEAAECLGKVSNRTWQYWESGRSKVPDDVDMELYALTQFRNKIILETQHGSFENDIPQFTEVGTLKWYRTHTAFQIDYPDENKVMWRLHQSVAAYLFTEGGEVELDAEIEVDKESYIYQWFSRTTAEQIEWAKEQATAKKLGLID